MGGHRLEKCAGLKATHLAHIRNLEAACNRFESLHMELNWDMLERRPLDQVNDFLLYIDDGPVGYLALFGFNQNEAEATAMTHPDYRRQGVFRRLLAAALQELARRRTPDILFFCEQASTSGIGTMRALKATYDFSEYKMRLKRSPPRRSQSALQLRPAGPKDLALLVQLDRLCFDVAGDASQSYLREALADPHRRAWVARVGQETIGKIVTLLHPPQADISGFCLLPAHRKKGYGTWILAETVARLLDEGCTDISLEVATDNSGALSLYERCGFEIVTAYDYYRLPVQPAS